MDRRLCIECKILREPYYLDGKDICTVCNDNFRQLVKLCTLEIEWSEKAEKACDDAWERFRP